MISLLGAMQLLASGPVIEIPTDQAVAQEVLVACKFASDRQMMFSDCSLVDDAAPDIARSALEAASAIPTLPGGHHIGVLKGRGIDPKIAVAIVRVRFVPEVASVRLRIDAPTGASVETWLQSNGSGVEEAVGTDGSKSWTVTLRREQLLDLLTTFRDVTVRAP